MKKDKKLKDELKKECHCNEGESCICEDECTCGSECTCEDNCTCTDECACGCSCECEDEECNCSHENNLEDQIKELQNKILYKDAEFVNFKRRQEEMTTSLLKYANQDLILDIVKSVDNFERAIESIKKDDEKDNKKILTGIEMIYNELKNTLTKYGVSEISEVNIPFDANIHHAVMTDNKDDVEDDTVVEVMMKGYKLKDRVIRPAMVKVNKIN